MIRAITCLIFCVGLTACVEQAGGGLSVGESRGAGISSDIIVRPKSRPDGFDASLTRAAAPRPPAAAKTVEDFDTTTAAQRKSVTKTPSDVGERSLGTTIASLGAPSEPGFWLKTPLVKVETQGRVFYPVTGKSVQVTLRPIDGPTTAGSRMSLPALRLLEAPLTGLPEVQVFADS
ncbi:MAG: hypothetical protein ABJL99_05035 [Aliishimia sp.]